MDIRVLTDTLATALSAAQQLAERMGPSTTVYVVMRTVNGTWLVTTDQCAAEEEIE